MLIKTASLSPAQLHVIRDKGTEPPFTGEYDTWDNTGTYLCRQCGLALYRSKTKFHSGCGWASFDDEVVGAVQHIPDSDGRRTEILCRRCAAHLGHVFQGENFTVKNTRHCVNSLSLDFVNDQLVTECNEVIVAGGCFWGIDYYFQRLPGVMKTEVGYIGGTLQNPTYNDVCRGNTGHREALRVLYNPQVLNLSQVMKYFFEIHDPTQNDGQGNDRGEQYQSVIFYYDDEQKQTAQILMQQLKSKGYAVATQLLPMTTFWRAEDYHQHYYEKNQQQPYCHRYEKRF